MEVGRRLKTILWSQSHRNGRLKEKEGCDREKKGRRSGGAACHEARQSDEASNEKKVLYQNDKGSRVWAGGGTARNQS